MLAKRVLGFLLLLAGWGLVLAAVGMLKSPSPRTAFVLAGVAVQALGLILTTRSHLPPRREEK